MTQTTYGAKAFSVASLSIMFLTSSVQTAQAASVIRAMVPQTVTTVQNEHTVFAGYVVPDPKSFKTQDAVNKKAIRTLRMDVTAYTSTPGECDGSPFITADGSVVHDGIVATNILPIGSKIRIPKYFGDRVFEVHDRMNARFPNRVDIWMSDKKGVRIWGMRRNAAIEVVEMGNGKRNWDQWKNRSADLARIGKHGPDALKIES